MTSLRRTIAACVLAGASLCPGLAAHAAESAHEQFLDFMSNGCVRAVLGAKPLLPYVQEKKLMPALPDLARSMLRDREGIVYTQNDAVSPMLIMMTSEGVCRVVARGVPKIDGLVAAVEMSLKGGDVAFKQQATTQTDHPMGGKITNRTYAAECGGQRYTVLLSTSTPLADLAEAVVAVALTTGK